MKASRISLAWRKKNFVWWWLGCCCCCCCRSKNRQKENQSILMVWCDLHHKGKPFTKWKMVERMWMRKHSTVWLDGFISFAEYIEKFINNWFFKAKNFHFDFLQSRLCRDFCFPPLVCQSCLCYLSMKFETQNSNLTGSFSILDKVWKWIKDS